MFSNFRMCFVGDELTRSCVSSELKVSNISPYFYYFVKGRSQKILFVESAWNGYKDRWKYKIAAYPDSPKRTNQALVRLVEKARRKGIPTIFWNKEDGVHHDRFIDSAKHFDHIFTVDETCIPRYREVVPDSTTVNTLMFPVQPRFHHFDGFNFKDYKANFTGSYSRHIHDKRRERQDFLLKAASEVLGLVVYDRNSKRKSADYRYPEFGNMQIRPAVPHDHTANIYKDHLVSLNVNTVTNSPTMYSRRLIEIIACGGIAVTTPAESVDRYFKDYCHIVDCYDEAHELFSRLKHGPSKDDLERARAGAEYVAKEHSWNHRLQEIAKVIGL